MVGPAGEPSLADLATMDIGWMLELNPDTVAAVLKALLPTAREISEAYSVIQFNHRVGIPTYEPLTLIRCSQWWHAANRFTQAFPQHEYARTAHHAAKWLEDEL